MHSEHPGARRRGRVLVWVCLAAVSISLPRVAAAQVDCWTPRGEEPRLRQPRAAGLRHALETAEALVRGNAAFTHPPEPVRMRPGWGAPDPPITASVIVVAVPPEHPFNHVRMWTPGR